MVLERRRPLEAKSGKKESENGHSSSSTLLFHPELPMEKTGRHKLITIYLFCPSLSTMAPFLASSHDFVDIGSIAAIFGLEPSSVKLNGHFLSRGRDLLSCLTWNSLLSFFSAKRLPIGGSHQDQAIVVDGKLSKIGLKRAHGPTGRSNLNNKKFKSMDLLGSKNMDSPVPVSKCSPNNDNKRKQHMEAVNLLKKLKLNETRSGFVELSHGGREIISNTANVVQRSAYSCSYNSKNMKRMREDETLVSTLCKKTR